MLRRRHRLQQLRQLLPLGIFILYHKNVDGHLCFLLFFRGHVRTIRVPLPNALYVHLRLRPTASSRSVTFCTPEPPA